MSQNVRQNNLFAAEDYTKIYKSFQNVNFIAYDVESIQNSLIDNLKINYPENYNDYIQSSEMIAHIQLLSYIASSLAFRTDLNARENIIDTAERRESIIRLARMVNYQPKRNIALSGLMKIEAVQTDAPLKDNLGRDLQNRTIFWDDANNVDSYDQFITILDSVMAASNPFGKPFKKQTINGIPTSLYQLNNKRNVEVAYPVSVKANGKNLAIDICNPDLDDDGVLSEIHPNPQNAFNIIHRNDGQGLSSINTGFFLYFKQGRMIKKDYKFDFAVKNRVVDVDVKNVNETDVFVQEINSNGEVLQEWTKIPNVNGGTNIIYNAISINNRNLYAVLPDTDDKIKLNFADGNFGNIPTGIFRTWIRSSANQNITLRQEQASGLEIVIPYIDKEGQNHNVRIIFSLQYNVSNAAISETTEQIKTRAPQVYYTQDRMVNNEDYNVFPLTRGNEIVKVRTLNRTHAGHSRYIDINDPTGFHQDLFINSDDGAIYKDSVTPSIEVIVRNEIANEPTIITTIDLVGFLSNENLKNFFYDEFVLQYKTQKQTSYVSTDTYNKYNVYEFVYNTNDAIDMTLFNCPYEFIPMPETDFDNKGMIYNTVALQSTDAAIFDSAWYSHDDLQYNEAQFGKLHFLSIGCKLKFINPLDSSEEKYVTVTSMTTEDNKGTLFVFDSEVNKHWIIKEVFPEFRTTFTDVEINTIKSNIENRNNFGIKYNLEDDKWVVLDTINTDLDFEYGVIGNEWFVNMQYNSDNNSYTFTSRGTNYIFESYRDVRFFFDVDQYNYDILTGKAKRDVIEVTTQNQMPQITEIFTFKNGEWVNVDDETIHYPAGSSSSFIPFQSRYMSQSDANVTSNRQPSVDFEYNYSTVGMIKLSGQTPTVGDEITITYIDKIPQIKYPVNWGIYDHVYQEDGYLDSSKVIVSPADADSDGVPDIMYSFQKLVADDSIVFLEDNITYDGYQNKRLWVSNWRDYRGVSREFFDFTFDDIVYTDLYLVDEVDVDYLKLRINEIIVESIFAPTSSMSYRSDEQLNKLNTTDVTVIYTDRTDVITGNRILNNQPNKPIMERINVDITKVDIVRATILTNSSTTVSSVISDVTMNPVTFTLDENHYIKHGRTFTENLAHNLYDKKTFDYRWHHFAPTDNRIDPSVSNLMDMTILTLSYYKDVLIWKNKRQPLNLYPSYPSTEELRLQFGDLNNFKMQSDQIVFNSGKFKLLFGKYSDEKLRAKFKVVKSPTSGITDNEAKTKVIEAIDIFFDIQNWDFGEAFYYTELAAFIHRYMSKFISSVVIVPNDAQAKFGDLFQIKAEPTELFMSIATIDDVEIVSNLTETNMRA